MPDNERAGLVEIVGAYAFLSCRQLERVVLPRGVRAIENHAFFACTDLRTVVLPSTIEAIGNAAFMSCNALDSVVAYMEEPFTFDYYNDYTNSMPFDKYTQSTLYVPMNLVEKYADTDGWADLWYEHIVGFDPNEHPEPVADMRGDVNGDGEVGIGDIVAVTNVMADTPGDVTMSRADVNGDGDVGIGDIVAITNIMAGAE